MPEEIIEEISWEGETVALHPKSRLGNIMFPHKASLVIPKTDKDKYILSKRSKSKYPFPDTWVCAIGGKVAHKESYLDAALREAMEEANASLELVPVTSFKYDEDDYKAVFTIYTTKEAIDINSLTADKGEVQYFEAFSLNEIAENIKLKPDAFAPTFRAALVAFVDALERNSPSPKQNFT